MKRAWLAAIIAALLGASASVHAGKLTAAGLGTVNVSKAGKTYTFAPAGSALDNAIAATPVTPRALSGTGTYSAMPSTGGNTLLSQIVDVTVGDKKLGVTLEQIVSKQEATKALGLVIAGAGVMGGGALGAILAAAEIAQWMANSDVRPNPNADNDPEHPFIADSLVNSTVWKVQIRTGCGASVVDKTFTSSTLNGVAQAVAAFAPGCPASYTLDRCETLDNSGSTAVCFVTGTYLSPGDSNYNFRADRTITQGAGEPKPVTFAEAVPSFLNGEMPHQTLERVLKEAEAQRGKNGVTPFAIDTADDGKVSGPSSLAPTETKKVTTEQVPWPTASDPSATGTKEVTTTTTTTPKLSYDGPKMTVTDSSTTTTTTKNPDGTTTTDTTKTEETTTKPDAPGLCDLYPGIVACEKGDFSDTPLPDLPKLYERKYPDGLKGIWTEKFTAIKATPLFQLGKSLMPTLPETGQCPSWTLDLNLASWAPMGTHQVGADCDIWGFAKVVVIVPALLLARALVFGG